jgi:broad specificity phosphatase PhoE
MRVHLVRHGRVDNPERIYYGRLDGFPLCERGRAQADRAGAWLAAHTHGSILLVSSPLWRTRQTAEAIRAAVGAQEPAIEPRVIERATWREGLPVGRRLHCWVARFANPRSRQRHEPPDAVVARMRAAVLDWAREARERDPSLEVVIVSHETPIRLCRLAFERGLDPRSTRLPLRLLPWRSLAGPCALSSITTLHLEGERCVDISYAEPASG